MARLPRIDVPGLPQHLILRGNNRTTCFHADLDRLVFLKYLREALEETGCVIHAYVLMTNHVHLLALAQEIGAMSRLMQSVGRRYARYFNSSYDRTGTLFEGRFKSSVVDTDGHFLTVMRYVELNPVRAGMVLQPGDYPWSSFRQNAGGEPSGLVTPHRLYESLGGTARSRARAYLALFDTEIDDDTLQQIRLHANKCRALGSDAFRDALAARLGRPVGIVRPGRRKRP
jgi:putative transposase